MKHCNRCKQDKPLNHFRVVKSTGKRHSWCQSCEGEYHRERRKSLNAIIEEHNKNMETKETTGTNDTLVIYDPREMKEAAMKRMLSSAKQRAKDKGLPFNLHYDDVQIPNLCPVLKIPLIPSITGNLDDNSPSLDRMVPYLGYIKGNVKVISMKANRIKSNATSLELEQVLQYVKEIEKRNVTTV